MKNPRQVDNPPCYGCVLWAVLFVSTVYVGVTNGGNLVKHMTENVLAPHFDEAAGHFYSCAADAAHNFTFSYLPHDVKMGHYILLSGSLTPAVDVLSTGTLCYEAYVPWAPDPIGKDCRSFTCADMNAIVKDICPITKGKPIKFSNVQYLFQVNGTISPAPYSVNGTIVNDLGHLLACFKGVINVVR